MAWQPSAGCQFVASTCCLLCYRLSHWHGMFCANLDIWSAKLAFFVRVKRISLQFFFKIKSSLTKDWRTLGVEMQTEWINTFPQPQPSNNSVQLAHSNQPLATLTGNFYYDLLQDALMNINEECNTSQLRLSSTCPQKHGDEVLRSQPTHRLLTPALTMVLTHNTNRGAQRTACQGLRVT